MPLSYTTESGKKSIIETVETLKSQSNTNLWDGLKTGMNVLTQADEASGVADLSVDDKKGSPDSTPFNPARLSAIFLLTDGMPNVEPPRGHIPMLRLYLESQPISKTNFTINTFGFGYQLDSQLLYEVASVGNGTYGFIPDSGMVGTVFVHATANLYATFAQGCEVDLESADDKFIKGMEVLGNFELIKASWGVKVALGALQYGQSRSLVVKSTRPLEKQALTISPKYRPCSAVTETRSTLVLEADHIQRSPDLRLQYHSYRLSFVSAILSLNASQPPSSPSSSFNPFTRRRSTSKSTPTSSVSATITDLVQIIKHNFNAGVQPSTLRDDALALATDLEGEVITALDGGEDKKAFERWGRHYLPALARAHQREQCGNFKDPGLQVYGRDSPLFIKLRNDMDKLFDDLPPPIPTAPQQFQSVGYGLSTSAASSTRQYSAPPSMSIYNTRSAPCFAEGSHILLSNGQTIPVESLRRGMQVRTPMGTQKVAATVRTHLENDLALLCVIEGLQITPWHPIRLEESWRFPSDIAKPRWTSCSAIYSVLLEAHASAEAHAVWVGGVLCVTLGHGLTHTTLDSNEGIDVRVHRFLGDYGMVVRDMAINPAFYDEAGVLESYGTRKSEADGLVCGFEWKVDTKALKVEGDWLVPSLQEISEVA